MKNGVELPLMERGPDGVLRKVIVSEAALHELRDVVSSQTETFARIVELLERIDDTDRIRTVEHRTEVEKLVDLPASFPLPDEQLRVLESLVVRALMRAVESMPKPATPIVNVTEAAAPVVEIPPFPKFPVPPEVQKVELVKAADVFPTRMKIDGKPTVRVENLDELAKVLTGALQVHVSAGGGGGLQTELLTKLLADRIPDESGSYRLKMGASGSVTVPAGARVLGAAAVATSGAGTVRVQDANNDETAPVPKNVGWELAPRGDLIAPTFTFTSTDSYTVEYIQ